MKKTDQQVINLAIKEYQEGKSANQLEKELGVSHTVLLRYIKEAGISTKRTGPYRKYNLNENFFDNPETWGEAQSYIYGFLLGDGYNNIKTGIVTIYLAIQDEELLKTINYLIQDRPIKYKSSEHYRQRGKNVQDKIKMQVYSRKISNKLQELGITKGKTVKCHLPTFLNDEQMRHVLRGLVDADACFHIKKSNGSMTFTLAGNKTLCSEFLNFLRKQIDINSGIVSKGRGKILHTVTIGGHYNIEKLYHLLYDDATIFLNRKKEKCDTYFKNPVRIKQCPYKGVKLYKGSPKYKYLAAIKKDKIHIHLGYFENAIDAAHAVDQERIKLYGLEEAKNQLNFYSHYIKN